VPESTVRRLDDGAKGNAGKGKADKVGVGAGGGVLAAGNVLLALLVDHVLEGNANDRDLEIQLGALVEKTKTIGAGATTDQVAEGATEDAGVDIGGVTSVGGLVAARELSLVTALGLSLLDSHAFRDREADIGVALVANTVGVADTASNSRGESGSEASESENGGDSELHCDCGFGIERRSRR